MSIYHSPEIEKKSTGNYVTQNTCCTYYEYIMHHLPHKHSSFGAKVFIHVLRSKLGSFDALKPGQNQASKCACVYIYIFTYLFIDLLVQLVCLLIH